MKKLVLPILFIALTFCIFISMAVIPPPAGLYVLSVTIFVVPLAIVIYSTRNQGSYRRKIGLSILACFSLGLGLFYGTGNFTYLILGILSIPFIILWLNYLRFPPHLWKFLWLFRRKRQAEAAQYINEWLREHPDDWKALALRSDFHLNRAQPAEAERDSRMVIKIKPDFHEGYNQLGRSLIVMAQNEEARRAFETAQRLKPNSAYLANIGIACYRLGDFPAAVEALTQATRSPLDHPFYSLAAVYLLGRSLEIMGETKKAQVAFNKMKRYADDLKSYIEQLNAAPDYPGTVASRADLLEIQQRLKM